MQKGKEGGIHFSINELNQEKIYLKSEEGIAPAPSPPHHLMLRVWL